MRLTTTSISIICTLVTISLNAQVKIELDDALKISSSTIYKTMSDTLEISPIKPGSAGANVIWDFRGINGVSDTLNIAPVGNSDTLSWNLSSAKHKYRYRLINNSELRQIISYPQRDYAVKFKTPLNYLDKMEGPQMSHWYDTSWVDGYGNVVLDDTTFNNCLRVKVTHRDWHPDFSGYTNYYYYFTEGMGSYVARVVVTEAKETLGFPPTEDSSYTNSISVVNIKQSKLLPNSPLNPNAVFNPVGVEDNAEFEGFVVFPNPATGRVNISIGLIEASEIKIYNLMGALVHHSLANSKEVEIDVSTLKTGVYSVVVGTSDKYYSTRLVIE